MKCFVALSSKAHNDTDTERAPDPKNARLQTELDDTMSCYQLIKTMTKFEKQTNHRLSAERLNVVMNAEKHSSLLNKVHCNSAHKMTRTVQLQA